MKTKKPSISKLKKKLWQLFSIYIRTRNLDEKGRTTCVTCGTKKHWKEMQAGHFVPGRTNGILFDERGIHAQCKGCNIFKAGNLIEYYPFMLKNYGQSIVDDLRRLSKTPVKITEEWYTEEIERLKKLCKKFTEDKK